MSNENIFNSQATPAEPTTPVVTTSPTNSTIPQELNDFVGTGKKYSSVEDALKSVPHAQKHISTLEQELAIAKAELDKRRTTEELLEELRNAGIPQASTNAPSGLDQATVTKLIEQTISQRETQRSAKENTDVVISTFTEKYGDKAEEFYVNLAKESGLSVQYLNSLAATSPSAVLKLAGLSTKPTTPTVAKTTGSINTEMFNTNNSATQESARVGKGGSTKELVRAWRAAGSKVGKTA